MKQVIMLILASFSMGVMANKILPANTDNTWTYESDYDESTTQVSITDYQNEWRLFSNFLGLTDQWVWTDDAYPEIFLWNGNDAELLFDHTATVGTKFLVSLIPGASFAEITGRATVQTLSGPLSTVTLTFGGEGRGPVIRSATFAEGVGVYQWKALSPVDSIATHTLTSCTIDGVVKDMTLAPKVKAGQISCKFNQLTSKIGEAASCGVKMTFTNTGDVPFVFNFSSGKHFDIELIDENGDIVRRWSDGKHFTQAFWQKTVDIGQDWVIGDYLDMAYPDGHPLESGTYVIRIEMKGFSASGVYVVTVD